MFQEQSVTMRSIFRGDRFIQFYFKTFSLNDKACTIMTDQKGHKKNLIVKNDNYTKNLNVKKR